MAFSAVFLMIAAAILAFLLLRREGLLERPQDIIFSIMILAVAFLLRAMFLPHETLDYQNFLSPWTEYFRTNNGLLALGQPLGNYNIPYLFFLALISYLPVEPLFLIKFFSVIWDILLALGCLRLVSLVTRSTAKRLFVFLMTLLLPTVLLNGSYWGQCDSIYVALAVWSIYHAMARQGIRAMIALAAAFAFKLQAIFVFPLFLVFLATGRIKWPHLFAFPLTYLILISPAVLAGRPLLETITLYASQTGSIGAGLNYNAPSIFALLGEHLSIYAGSLLGIAAAGISTLLLLWWLLRRRRELDNESLLCAAVLFAVVLPFLLPHMHDRYFFLADILTLVFAVVLPRHFLLPVLAQFASLLGYHAYLRQRYLLPMSWGTIAFLAVICFLLGYLSCNLYPRRRKNRLEKP